jgi:hypothetical protein
VTYIRIIYDGFKRYTGVFREEGKRIHNDGKRFIENLLAQKDKSLPLYFSMSNNYPAIHHQSVTINHTHGAGNAGVRRHLPVILRL